MPEGYEKMRDEFIKEGMGEKKAKAKAAAIWNDKNPDNPVTRSHKDEAEPNGKILDGDIGKILKEDPKTIIP